MEKQYNAQEQRQNQRRSYLKSVKIKLGERIISGMIHNIGIGGVYIEAHEKFSVGQIITISYFGSDNQNEIEVKGKVIRTNAGGFALEYL